ncbi:class I SAM-dependent methyltransferase [Mycolicibacterium sp. 120266]|uniref:class I SAM-dependent methyltransferase n=1 Tax=Mycolicibacterium sp. 120266 TaxID=3090601 RepID=UPI00299E04E9|nr:class I SAM-dependent methyltransferase [Mycolicibacterium sp. 120266]MDX1872260.1 class I SAM-dependent methyltransferase [Mycolicibacterium sp. 120266]
MTAIDNLRSDYDATPYVSNSFPQSAPGTLAAVAHLFGLHPPDVGHARVLEIGCAAGGNIVPFAAAHPDAEVVGIDLSEVQIAAGRARVQALGIDNLRLIAGDIAAMDVAALGAFDYIVAHGVYSWVPDDVAESLLAAMRAGLSTDGVGYLSYNVYPGWKAKEVVRDAMMLAAGSSQTPEDKVRHARGMADFLSEVAPAGGVLAAIMAEWQSADEGFGDSYLLHDELETFNTPRYFYEVLARANAHGLAYLGEARPEVMVPANHGPRVAEYLAANGVTAQVLVEQYLDFVTNRTFRQSLFVPAERAPQIEYSPTAERLRRLHLAALVPPIDGPVRLDHSRQEFRQTDGATLFTNAPAIKAALDALTECWPWTMSHDELVVATRERLLDAGAQPSTDLPVHIDDLTRVLVMQGQANYRLHPVRPEPMGTSPRIDEYARRAAELTADSDDAATFNRWHETVPLEPLDRHLLPLLDGSRDDDQLIAALLAAGAGTRDVVTEHVRTLAQRLAELKLG